MKLIRCYTRMENLDGIRHKLFELGAPGLSVTEAKGIGKPLSQLSAGKGRAAQDVPLFKSSICVEIVLEDESVEDILAGLKEVCRTGQFGDGKVFIIPVDDAVRMRTGESGVKSLY